MTFDPFGLAVPSGTGPSLNFNSYMQTLIMQYILARELPLALRSQNDEGCSSPFH
jgi:hypothetical protein